MSRLKRDYDHFQYPVAATWDDLERLRGDLNVIMAFTGWTCDTLAALIGVSRATVTCIKNDKGRMSVTQYLAICYLIDKECEDNQALREAINIMNQYGEYDMTREELVTYVEDKKKHASTKLGIKKFKDELRHWMLNGEE